MVTTGPTLIRLMLVVLATTSLAGCELIGGIFKAGFYTGIIVVIVLVALIAFGAMKLKR